MCTRSANPDALMPLGHASRAAERGGSQEAARAQRAWPADAQGEEVRHQREGKNHTETALALRACHGAVPRLYQSDFCAGQIQKGRESVAPLSTDHGGRVSPQTLKKWQGVGAARTQKLRQTNGKSSHQQLTVHFSTQFRGY